MNKNTQTVQENANHFSMHQYSAPTKTRLQLGTAEFAMLEKLQPGKLM